MRRRFAVLTVSFALIGGLVATSPGALAGPSPQIVGIGPAHAGFYSSVTGGVAPAATNDIENMAEWATSNANGRVTFAGNFHDVQESDPNCPFPWGPCWSGNTDNMLEQAWDAEATPVVNLTIGDSAFNIASGDWDTEIVAWAQKVKDWTERTDGPQRTLFIAPLQEQNGDWVPYGCDPNNFILAYKKIRSLAQGIGLNETLVRWVWAPNGYTSTVGACGNYNLADYYPGSAFVDVIGYSSYRWAQSENVYFAVGGVADWLRVIAPEKPYLVLQTAAGPSASRDQWIVDLMAWAASDENVVGVVWFNIIAEQDWRVWRSDNSTGLAPGWRTALSSSNVMHTWPLTDWFAPGPLNFSPVPEGQMANRVSGSNRYATAVAVSEATFDPGVPIVYVATGKAFPDALAAAAAAGALGGPVLLSDTTSISSDTLAEIRRLSPNRIVVVGGTSAVSDAVKEQLAEIAPTDRIGGSNRYDTAARIALDAFDGPVPIAYVATGKDFPDALAAAAAAGAQGGPVLLTEPGFLPSWTSDALIALQPNKIVVVGGTAVVSTAVEASLNQIQDNTERVAGSNRFHTAALLAEFSLNPNTVFVATGRSFPDALAGAAAAGFLGLPLLLTEPTFVPPNTSTKLGEFVMDPMTVIVLGGTSVITQWVSWQLWLAANG